jgi:putative Mg2+ transporter-C (MgtC) family protein
MAGQIVVGVGFIGGGLLFRDGTHTKGINTAATLWCCAAVGILCGIHRWVEASIATFTIVSANTILRQMAQYLNLKMGANDSLSESVLIHLRCQPSDVGEIQQYIGKYCNDHQLELKAATSEQLENERVQLTFTVLFEHGQFSHAGNAMLQNLNPPGAVHLSWAVN